MTATLGSRWSRTAALIRQGRRPVYVRQTAQRTLSSGQRAFAGVAVAALLLGLVADALLTLRVVLAGLMVFSAAYLGLRCLLVAAAARYRYPARATVPEDRLPRYTTLHPMYDEANMIPQVVAAMEALDYPKDRLQCLLVLEERDRATVEAARSHPLPDYFEIVETPAVKPYGKPKACNYALQFATGDYVVIFDAEDRPEPLQLRKAVETFQAAADRDEPLGCLQARLVFDNEAPLKGSLGEVLRDNDGYDVRPSTWCTRFLGNEYGVHFELVLAGLAHLGLPVPLGGTSNHFPTSILRDVAFHPAVMPDLPGEDRSIGAWDPWNVTEDAELGGAIAAHGYTTAVFDSHTDEEAVLTPVAAVNQRSRWVKGFAQTSLVLTRRPVRNMLAMGPAAFAAFLLQVGGTYLSLLIAPLTWGLTAAYFLTRSERIVELFPGPMLAIGVVLLVGGNIALVTISLATALRRHQFGAVRFLLVLTPLWWMVLSAAAWVATVELAFPRWRPSWNKTAHGVRYASRRRSLWLATQGSIRRWESRTPRPRESAAAWTSPALAPSGAAPVARQQAARERIEAAQRAALAGRAAARSAPVERALIDRRRAAAQAARKEVARTSRTAPRSRAEFGSGVAQEVS